MENKKDIIESSEEFSVTFGGGSSIGTELYSKSIESIGFLVKESGKIVGIKSSGVTEFDSPLRLEIKANEENKEGNFNTRFILTVQHLPILGSVINITGEILDIVLSWIELKQHLKGSREKNRQDLDNNKSTVENKNGEKKTFSTPAVKRFLDNSRVDKSIVNLFSQNNRKHVSLGLKEASIQVQQNEFVEMTSIIPIGEETVKREVEDITAELHIKKPDLLGKSMWGFVINNELIEATVKDDSFLNKVHDGSMKLNAGLQINCKIQTESKIDKKGQVTNIKYTVLKVMGEPFPAINKLPKGLF